ncbi:hypothetical protein [Cellvibrio fontiphilus]|uniref:Uncharacterized protein n=1 Tax=Cellvibrio fontiphilus TaxID=1815559 RepID=A0ABV7FIH5_9GAMM
MNKLWCLIALCASLASVAQEDEVQNQTVQNEAPSATEITGGATETKKSAAPNQPARGEANINLRTTVTGNQEQPRVMYILPWQSPLSPELDMEMLGSEADAVFGHVERDELTRQLEAAGELDTTD